MSYSEQALALAKRYSIQTPLEDQATLFLSAIWGKLPTAGATVGITADVGYVDKYGAKQASTLNFWDYLDGWTPCVMLAQATKWNTAPVYTKDGKGSIFYNAASRDASILQGRSEKSRGRHDQLLHVGAFWVDLDMAKSETPLHKGVEALLAMPLPPTFIVFSGGGLQAIHLLSEPYDLRTPDAIRQYKQRSLSLYKIILSQPYLEPDTSVHEAARMMRLPGFVNRKPSRDGAVARIIYHDPAALYSLDQINAVAPIPDYIAPEPITITAPIGTYRVTPIFMDCLVNRKAKEGSRHGRLTYLCVIAAQSGIPREDFEPKILALAGEWYPNEPERLTEIPKELDWAYSQPLEAFDGRVLVYSTADGYQPVYDELWTEETNTTINKIPALPTPAYQSLETIREAQAEVIDKYLSGKFRKNIGTVLSLETAPGVGKTYSALRVSYKYALEGKKVLYLSQFKPVDDGAQWAKDNTLDPKDVVFYAGRTDDESSPGYCARFEVASELGAKGHDPCFACKLLEACKVNGYKAQLAQAGIAPIVRARFQHAKMEELVAGRDIIIVDESVTDVVSQCIEVTANDIKLDAPAFVKGQFESELAAVESFVDAIYLTIQHNPSTEGWSNEATVSLGGYRFFAEVDKRCEVLRDVMQLPAEFIKKLNPVKVDSEGKITAIPVNYLLTLFEIFKYEYEMYYTQGVKAWNSRIIPDGNKLCVYPMTPLGFKSGAKVISLDATTLPALQEATFSDNHEDKDGNPAPRPRHIKHFSADIQPAGAIVQWYGAENTKNSILREVDLTDAITPPKSKLPGPVNYLMADTIRLRYALIDQNNAPLGNLIALTHNLARRHNGNLLVITYKGMLDDGKYAELYTKWLDTAGITRDKTTYFGNVRGKNDWKDTEAVLVVGTPRIPPMDVLKLAQVWNWRDPNPINTASMDREIAYPIFKENTLTVDGKGRVYRYRGYADKRVDDLYVHLIQSELRQCYERIRPNTVAGNKMVYLATSFPCTDHLSELRPESDAFRSIYLDYLLDKYVLSRPIDDPNTSAWIKRRILVDAMVDGWRTDNEQGAAKDHVVTEKTADAIIDRAIATGGTFYKKEYRRWRDLVKQEDRDGISYIGRIEATTAPPGSMHSQIKDWIAANPTLATNGAAVQRGFQLAVNQGRQDGEQEIKVSRSAVFEALKEYKSISDRSII